MLQLVVKREMADGFGKEIERFRLDCIQQHLVIFYSDADGSV
jgi:hypothetical protein